MREFWTYTGCNEDVQRDIHDLWQTRRQHLAARLATVDLTGTELRISVTREDDQEPIWRVQMAAYLPAQTLFADRSANELDETMQAAIDELVSQVDQKAEKPERAARRREGMQAIVPLLERCYQAKESKTFFTFMQPVLKTLAPYARRELQVRQIEGNVRNEQVTASDVLDEALLMAWDQFGKRPKDKRLDLWMLQLMDDAIRRLGEPSAPESLNDRVSDPDKDPAGPRDDMYVEQAVYLDTLELTQLIPSSDGTAGTLDELDIEDKEQHLAWLLSGLPHEQRQALVLSLADGYETAMIADFQDRSVEEVERDIAEGQAAIARRLAEEEQPDIDPSLQRPGGRDRGRRRRMGQIFTD